MQLPDPHQRFLDRALPIMQADSRILGVAAGGSLVSHTLDEFSDLDLVIVSSDDDHAALVAEARQTAERLGETLAAFTAEHVGVPNMIIALYADPLLHVDLKYVGLTGFGDRIENPRVLFERDGVLTKRMADTPPVHPQPDPQWIEDRFWVWVHYTALKIGRGELFETLAALAFLREQVLGPLSLLAHGELPRGVRRLDTLAPRHFQSLQATTAGYDWHEACEALLNAIDLYRELRSEVGGGLKTSLAEKAAVNYANTQIDRRLG
ncbi:MAG: nucleotidyltransferase domain-containing protein [Planctomycetes bacterium]|nr:nucleotidyltransferase domain-containing protein [Planctomycetota bacterium]